MWFDKFNPKFESSDHVDKPQGYPKFIKDINKRLAVLTDKYPRIEFKSRYLNHIGNEESEVSIE